MNIDFKTINWVRRSANPEFDKVHGDRMYYYEPGCEYGFRDENGVLWYRISCSYWFGDWIETQNTDWWKSYGAYHRAIYMVRKELMFLINLHWA